MLRSLPTDGFRRVHLGALWLSVVMLPWSEFGLSLAQLILLGNWIVEGVVRRDLGGRFKRAFTDAASAVWLSFFGLHLLGLFWTSDLKWGADLCRILLPVLGLGLVLASVPRLSARELRALLLFGAWSTAASALVCLLLRHDVIGNGEYRELSIFISHIRLALMLCFSVATFVVLWPVKAWQRAAHVLAIVWCLFFLDRLSSLLAIVILGVLALVAVVRWSRHQRVGLRVALWGVIAAVVIALGLYVRWCVQQYERMDVVQATELQERSPGGEIYYHNLKAPQRENGHPVWIYVADKELARGWQRLSAVPFDSLDTQGQPLRWTLVRYLASLNAHKDSLGLLALQPTDVRRIEQGVTNVKEGRRDPLRARIDQVLFELESYRISGDPSGHSVTMRREFLHIGWCIAKAHWVTGVGTGDTQLAFNEAYTEQHSPLDARWRLRAHNEYLTLWISFGVFGLLWSLFSWWWPARRNGAFGHPLFIAWGIIFLISCLSEDTLETQMGATFFALYYTLFTFAAPKEPSLRSA
ncbi:MAG TPA: O-antigen ligase family protein [Flavobacteriales bacterium]|nr:O-antigen ligase family protein [Flavobacteriales bacterium]